MTTKADEGTRRKTVPRMRNGRLNKKGLLEVGVGSAVGLLLRPNLMVVAIIDKAVAAQGCSEYGCMGLPSKEAQFWQAALLDGADHGAFAAAD